MKSLPTPIRRAVREIDVEIVERAWQAIDRKRGNRRTHRGVVAVAFAMAAALAILVLALRSPARGPLRTAGAVVTSLPASAAGFRTTLSDGSVIALAPATSLAVLENTDLAFTTLLGAGAATFDVVPGGPRRWRVELGCGAVEVVGTRFSIDRRETRVEIRVERGAVLVRSDLISPHHVERLEAGASIVLEIPAAPAASVSSNVAPPPAAHASEPAASVSVPPSGGDVDELFRRADVARRAGRAGEAAMLLRRIANEHPSDPRAAVATFTLAKLELDSLGAAGAAANDFARAIAMGLPGALREDAEARRIQALARSGRIDEARALADRFRRDHPSSPTLTEIDRWTGASPLSR